MAPFDLKIVIAFARTHNALFGNIEKSLKRYKLSISEFGVLEMLYHKGRQPVQQIAEKILVTSGTITYVIDRLVQKGYVIRKKCTEDKRRYFVELTDDGERLISRLFPEHEQFLEELFAGMDVDSKQVLIEKLGELKQSIDQK